MMSGTQNLNGTASYDPEHVPYKTKAELNNFEVPSSPKNKTLCQGSKETYFEYCSNTSIHGVQYLGREYTWIEKLFWICVFIVSIGFCWDAIAQTYNKWNETPVIVSFSEKSTNVWKIPFPAVTICSETKRPQKTGPTFKQLQKYFDEDLQSFPSNMSATELDEFLTLLQICRYDGNEREGPFKQTPIDYLRILNEMLPKFSNQFSHCTWFSPNYVDCGGLFTKTYTEEGICYTFNGLNATDLYREDTVQYEEMGLKIFAVPIGSVNRSLSWSLEGGYAADSSLRTYPARVLSSGSKAGLSFTLGSVEADIDYGCRGATQGYKLLLHSPDDVPAVSRQFVRISMGEEVLILVKPQMMETSDGIANHPPEKRQCYLGGERHLRFFKIYSENNCNLECLTNFTISTCGCVKYSMPRTREMTVCAEDKINCMETAENQLMHMGFSGSQQNSNNNCNCLPACTSLEYDTEISQGRFDADKAMKARDPNYDPSVLEFSSLSIYFKDNVFITSKRSELFGFYDFLASCGGILGLFVGVSIISFVEIVYHFTLRLWTNMRRKDDVD